MPELSSQAVSVSVSGGHTFTFHPGTAEWAEAVEMLQGRYSDDEILDGGETTVYRRQ